MTETTLMRVAMDTADNAVEAVRRQEPAGVALDVLLYSVASTALEEGIAIGLTAPDYGAHLLAETDRLFGQDQAAKRQLMVADDMRRFPPEVR